MEKELKLSVIVYNDGTEQLGEGIRSILETTAEYGQIFEIILTNVQEQWQQETDLTEAELGRIVTIAQLEDSKEAAYQHGLEQVSGSHVFFMCVTSSFGPTFAECVSEFFEDGTLSEQYPLANITCKYQNPKGETSKYTMYGIPTSNVIDIEENPRAINLQYESFIFDKKILKPDFFENWRTQESGACRLLELLLERKQFYFLRPCAVTFRNAVETDSYNYQAQFTKDWYTPTILEEWIPMLEKHPESAYLQNVLFYMLQVRFACNWNDRNKAVIEDEEIDEFFAAVRRFLGYIDDKVITTYDGAAKKLLPKFMCYHMLRFKYDAESYTSKVFQNKTFLCGTFRDELIDNFSTITAAIWAINYENGKLMIDGRLSNVYYISEDEIDVYLNMGGRRYLAKKNKIYALHKFFGHSVNRDLTFTIEIPEEDFDLVNNLGIEMCYGGINYKLPMKFAKIQARIANQFSKSYWNFGDFMLTYSSKKKNMIVRRADKKIRRKQEHQLYKQYMKKAVHDVRARKVLALRALYWITRPFYRNKNVWMTFDQLFKGGDNGEYFFRYVSDRKDKGNIRMYYVLNKTAPEYKALHKKYGRKVLIFNSIRHKLVSLHTDMIFATRVDVKLYCGFGPQLEPYFRGLFNGKIFCLQHGLTIQRIAQYQNRLFDNTRLYFCVSPYERENLSHEVYDYEPEQLVMTGAPRYDGLVSKDKKQILITPTWRRSVTAGTNSKGSMNEYSVNFKHTEYFRLYNTLINDKRLIECAKKCGYKLIYLIHPILSPQISDYETNEYVKIIPGSEVNYEQILSESSLMLTDYSGIQFDFAYMRKPLVYYHPNTLPPQYEAGGLQYDTMGFGPVCADHESVVKELCAYMEQSCQMTDMYRKRVDDFFAFDDRNNCQRVYEETLKYMERIKKSEPVHKLSHKEEVEIEYEVEEAEAEE